MLERKENGRDAINPHVSQIHPAQSEPLPLPPSLESLPFPARAIRQQPAMARPSFVVVLPLLALLSLAAIAAFTVPSAAAALGGGGRGGRGPLVGGWSPIPDVGDAHIQELGGWALGEAKRAQLAGDGLRFRRVTRGEQQVVSGMNYRLVVDAADPAGRSTPYVAQVYEQVWTSTRQLTSFKPVASAH